MFKKILSMMMVLSFVCLNTVPCIAATEKTKAVEHLDVHKDAPCNVVTITDSRKVIEQGNVLQFQFDEKFFSKKAQTGQIINFVVTWRNKNNCRSN